MLQLIANTRIGEKDRDVYLKQNGDIDYNYEERMLQLG